MHAPDTVAESVKYHPGLLVDVQEVGAAVIPGVYSEAEILQARNRILDNIDLMKNTRPTASARHLVGFERYPQLQSLHHMMTDHPVIQSCIESLCGKGARTIGLTDITVNRSQQWHKDLLRGPYQTFMKHDSPCASYHGKVFKVLVYLQDSGSLKIIPGSHKRDIVLENDEFAIPQGSDAVQPISVRAGDVVIIDICTTHRGSAEADFESESTRIHPKILISTVYGAANCPFTDNMEAGNAVRMKDWMARWNVKSMSVESIGG